MNLLKNSFFVLIIFLNYLVSFSSGRKPRKVLRSCNKLLPNDGIWTKNVQYALRYWVSKYVPLKNPKRRKDRGPTKRGKEVLKASKNIRWSIFENSHKNGWLYGKVDSKNKYIPEETYYIYPDLFTVLVGTFRRKMLIRGVETKITHYRCQSDTVELRFAPLKSNATIFKYYERTRWSIAYHPLIRDPFERKNVYIARSQNLLHINNEDSLYAKTFFPLNTLVAYISGSWITLDNYLEITHNMTDNDLDIFNKYITFYNDSHFINLLPNMDDLSTYRATIGHKINHNFSLQNTVICRVIHPLYGRILGIQSQKEINRGDELFTNYNYDPLKLPKWYNNN